LRLSRLASLAKPLHPSCLGCEPLLWDLVVGEAALALTTMARWLRGAAPLGPADLGAAYQAHSDFYFLAAPPDRAAG
jgi:hypothetical protein